MAITPRKTCMVVVCNDHYDKFKRGLQAGIFIKKSSRDRVNGHAVLTLEGAGLPEWCGIAHAGQRTEWASYIIDDNGTTSIVKVGTERIQESANG